MPDTSNILKQKTGIYFSDSKYKAVLAFVEKAGIKPKNYTELIEYLIDDFENSFEKIEELRMNALLFKEALMEDVETLKQIDKILFPFLLKTNHAFKSIFQDDNFKGMDEIQLLRLLVDFCERDPTNEFPLQEAAEKIYQEVKNTQSEINNTSDTESQPENGNRPEHGEGEE